MNRMAVFSWAVFRRDESFLRMLLATRASPNFAGEVSRRECAPVPLIARAQEYPPLLEAASLNQRSAVLLLLRARASCEVRRPHVQAVVPCRADGPCVQGLSEACLPAAARAVREVGARPQFAVQEATLARCDRAR
jgi:hypothetical protein